MTFQLREYQGGAIEKTRDAMRRGSRRIIMYSPTGSGKTEIAIEIIRSAMAKGKRVLFVCPRINLVLQSSRRLHKSGLDHGIVQGANTRDVHKSLLVCSIQTIDRRGFPEHIDLIVVDEAHGAISESHRKLIIGAKCPVIGLTATPFSKGLGKVYPELDGKGLFEEIVVAATISGLIDLGFLVDVDIYAPSEPNLKGVKITAGDYNEKQLGERVDQTGLIGDIVQHWIKLANGVRTVVFATNILHSQHIVEQFNAAGIKAEHMDCFTDDATRAAILGRLERGETRIISNVSILAEGWDCPSVECCILARPTKSLTRYIQMVGRALRPAPGKARALLLDHSGSCRRLGFPTDDLPLVLDDGSVKPKDEDEQAIIEKKPRSCEACHFMIPPGVHACPKCGHVHVPKSEVEHLPGSLEKLKKFDKVEKQRVYSCLLTVQKQKGYADGWVSNKYRAWFGVWPSGLERTPRPVDVDVKNELLRQAIAYSKSQAGKPKRMSWQQDAMQP